MPFADRFNGSLAQVHTQRGRKRVWINDRLRAAITAAKRAEVSDSEVAGYLRLTALTRPYDTPLAAETAHDARCQRGPAMPGATGRIRLCRIV